MSQNYRTLKQLIPVELGEASDIDLGIEGRAIDKLQASADRLLANIFADTAYELLSDWERILGVVPGTDTSTGVRVAAVVAQIRAKGGLSRPFFINLAATLGYEITIDEPDEFMAGWSGANEDLTDEDIVYIWIVNILNEIRPVYYFYTGANGAGDSLCDFSASALETIFEELKPAETLVFFTYPYTQE